MIVNVKGPIREIRREKGTESRLIDGQPLQFRITGLLHPKIQGIKRKRHSNRERLFLGACEEKSVNRILL